MTCLRCHDAPTPRPPEKNRVAPAHWRDKGELIYSAREHAAYQPKPEHWAATKDIPDSDAPSHADPLTHHALSYLNGPGGTGKTWRTSELYRGWRPLVFTPTHRLAKEMRARGVDAQTYHSFFRWSGQTEWTPDRMGQKFVPRVIIWDEVCTVPRPILETFLAWLDSRSWTLRSSAVATRGSHHQLPARPRMTGCESTRTTTRSSPSTTAASARSYAP